MLKTTAMILFVLGVAGQASAQSPNLIAEFEGAIGVIPVSGGAGTPDADGTLPNVRPNVVRGVNPAGGPWIISGLRADVDIDGRIEVRGRGLLLASGNGIATNANQRVFATLTCEAAAPFVQRSTSSTVPLALNGDFLIDDTLSPVPDECPSPVLLIRNAGGAWFAAGIPKLRN
jgi:hypothetical protein